MRLALAIVVVALADTRDAGACSCVGPHLEFVSPVSDAAPTNAHIRVRTPTGITGGTFVVRVHGGSEVAVQSRTIPGAMLTTLDLVPTSPLPPSTRFEVATVDRNAHPPITVIGTFKTGSSPDTIAPRLDSLGHQGTHLNAQFGGGMCSIAGPWITLAGMVVHDDRADAQLGYEVWAADRSGRIDTTRTPDALLFPYNGTISIGQTSLCDPSRFTFSGNVVTLAVAAVDESGNVSRPLRLRADLTHDAP